MADLLRAVSGFIQRAMAYGLTRDQAVRLCRDCIARERRSRFTDHQIGPRRRTVATHVRYSPSEVVGSGRHRTGSMSLPRASRSNDYFSELLIEANTPLRLVPRPFTAAMIASEIPAAMSGGAGLITPKAQNKCLHHSALISIPALPR